MENLTTEDKHEASMVALMSEGKGEGNFCPHPKIEFLVDTPEEMVCEICQDKKLRFCFPRHDRDDRTPAILPCGHVFGLKCLNVWLENSPSCPTCRLSLRYELCPHTVPAKALDKTTIYTLPATLKEGGKIPDQCQACDAKTTMTVLDDIKESFVRRFRHAREKFRVSGEDKDKAAMLQYKARLEDFVAKQCFKVADTARW